MRRIKLCLILLVALISTNLNAEPESGERLTLADGTNLFVKILKNGITEEGLSVKWMGAPMQIEWKLIDASAAKGLRVSLVDWKNPKSLRSYGTWCTSNGLTKEFEQVAKKYEDLTGKSIVRPIAPEPVVEPDDPEPDSEPGDEPESPEVKEPEPDEEPEPEVKKKSGGDYLPVYVKKSKKSEQKISAALSLAISKSGVKLAKRKKKGETAVVELKKAEFKRGRNPRFFGGSLYLELSGIATVEVLGADGKVIEAKSFETGIVKVYPKEIAHLRKKRGRTSLGADEALLRNYTQDKVTSMLVSSISSWAKGFLPREEVESND